MLFPSFTPFDLPIGTSHEHAPRVTIHGIRSVETSGPPLLLLHGFPQNHLIWHKVAPELIKHFTVVALDLRGYGHSSKPRNRAAPNDHSLYAKSAMAADCAAVMAHLGYEKFYLMAHDRGARVAHKLCVDRPDAVIKCVLLDIAPTRMMYETTDMLFARAYWHWFFLIQPTPFPERIILSNPEYLIEKQVAGMHAKRETFADEAYNSYVDGLRDEELVHANCEDYRASAQEDIAEAKDDEAKGKKIKCPLLVLWGKYGLIERKYDGKLEWERVSEPGCVDAGCGPLDCGHYIPEEAPEDLVKRSLEFFKV